MLLLAPIDNRMHEWNHHGGNGQCRIGHENPNFGHARRDLRFNDAEPVQVFDSSTKRFSTYLDGIEVTEYKEPFHQPFY